MVRCTVSKYWISNFVLNLLGEEVKFSKWTLNGDWVSSCLIVCSNCNQKFGWFPQACNITDSINVVCHSGMPFTPEMNWQFDSHLIFIYSLILGTRLYDYWVFKIKTKKNYNAWYESFQILMLTEFRKSEKIR